MSIFYNRSFYLNSDFIKSIGSIILLINDIHTAVQNSRFLCKIADTFQFTLQFSIFATTSHILPISTFREETLHPGTEIHNTEILFSRITDT